MRPCQLGQPPQPSPSASPCRLAAWPHALVPTRLASPRAEAILREGSEEAASPARLCFPGGPVAEPQTYTIHHGPNLSNAQVPGKATSANRRACSSAAHSQGQHRPLLLRSLPLSWESAWPHRYLHGVFPFVGSAF
ncbi:hypothetical protein BDV95DRAFT_260309 [Massariosphaeria phaeospora]|uniref:Uncharacterized protein n=1 Tax=Massariosphaeria phaeospora TaxID=100035 RepID=A0A7C8I180_9PLEO|nr:hypothetical protein BDV95DRAFT_260309 [Massariosphaeria phaeospora]